MTEEQWLTCTDPHQMLRGAGDRLGERKLVQFALVCAQRVSGLLSAEGEPRRLGALGVSAAHPGDSQETSRAVVEVGLEVAHLATRITGTDYVTDYSRIPSLVGAVSDLALVVRVARAASQARAGRPVKALRIRERRIQRQALRDIAGNPFRPVTVDPSWLAWGGGAVVKIARAIADSATFRDMPILADALEDAGCSRRELLDHCRHREPHVRGCWVLDCLLRGEGRPTQGNDDATLPG